MAAALQRVSLTAMGPQACQSTSLSLSLFICKMGIMTAPTPQGCGEAPMGWCMQSVERSPKELTCGCFHRRATSRTLIPSPTHFYCSATPATPGDPENKESRSPTPRGWRRSHGFSQGGKEASFSSESTHQPPVFTILVHPGGNPGSERQNHLNKAP